MEKDYTKIKEVTEMKLKDIMEPKEKEPLMNHLKQHTYTCNKMYNINKKE